MDSPRAAPADDAPVARSPAMQQLLETVRKVAASDAIVRITGESGAGKGFLARLLHQHSSRADHPFVEVACANLPEALFESELFGHEKGSHTDATEARRGRLEDAGQGTVLFDGIGELSPAAQAKLLRVLQERSFERLGGGPTVPLRARVLATSAADLEEAVRQGAFRGDLFYRLDVVRLEVPPLRRRREDLPRLATLFLRHYRRRHRRPMRVLTPSARRRLEEHSWPGNVRELRNVIEHAVLTVDRRDIDASDLRLGAVSTDGILDEAARADRSLAELEAAYIARVLERCGGNQTRAAAVLGISRKTLLHKRRRYGLG